MCEVQGSLLRIDKQHFIDSLSELREDIFKFEKSCVKLLVDDRDLFDNIKWYNSVNKV